MLYSVLFLLDSEFIPGSGIIYFGSKSRQKTCLKFLIGVGSVVGHSGFTTLMLCTLDVVPFDPVAAKIPVISL